MSIGNILIVGACSKALVSRKNKLEIIGGSHQPVGEIADLNMYFIEQKFKFDGNKTIYLYSDGFVDPFYKNGGFKYGPKRFFNL